MVSRPRTRRICQLTPVLWVRTIQISGAPKHTIALRRLDCTRRARAYDRDGENDAAAILPQLGALPLQLHQHAVGSNLLIGAKARIAGLKLRATDDLSGDGVRLLRERCR
jgi:hypothetical protein